MSSLTCLELFKSIANEGEQQLLVKELLRAFVEAEPFDRIMVILDQLSEVIMDGLNAVDPPWSVRCAMVELLEQFDSLQDKCNTDYLGEIGLEKLKAIILRLVPFTEAEADRIDDDAIQEFIDEEFCEHGAEKLGLTLDEITKAQADARRYLEGETDEE